MRRFRRGRETPELPPSVRAAMADLRALAQQRPSLAPHALIVADVLPILFAVPTPIAASILTAGRIAEKWSAGTPLLRGEDLPLNTSSFAQRWRELCRVVANRLPNGLQTSAADFDISETQVRTLVRNLLVGDGPAVRDGLLELGVEAGPAMTILNWAALPVLSSLQVALGPVLPPERWQHGYCPICGSWPLLGEFRGLEQVRYLRCGLCAMAWEFPRLRCPFCGNNDHRQVGYLNAEGDEGKQRIATCDDCRGYVKVVASLTALEPVRLLVMEAATLPLDLVAAAHGYAVP